MKLAKTPRFARLLPSVVVVGAGLLILNGSGLVHDAYAGIVAFLLHASGAPAGRSRTTGPFLVLKNVMK